MGGVLQHCSGSSLPSITDHASEGFVEDPRWGAVVEGTGFLGVDNVAFYQPKSADDQRRGRMR